MYKSRFDFTNKIAAITGGSRGIGLAIAGALHEFGATVCLLDIDEQTGNQVVNKFTERGRFHKLDVTDVHAVKACAEEIYQQEGHVDILINCAGIARITPAFDADDDEWRQVIDINLNGTYWCCREFARMMAKQNSGCIVNMGSMSGIIVNRPQPETAYIASKAAVHMLTKSLACEWVKHHIRVNALAPGYIATDLTLAMRNRPELFNEWIACTPMQRCGSPDEVASAALFLASDAASYITGTILEVDGGYTAW